MAQERDSLTFRVAVVLALAVIVLLRNVWTVTDLLSLAASAARRQASCNARLVIGRAGLRPGNSQCDGRVACQ